MGKTKKVNSNDKEEGQKKISNFFQKADERKIQKSSLFREVGASVTSKSTQPCLKACKTDDDNTIVLSDSDEFIEPKVKSKTGRNHLSRTNLQNDLKGFIDTEKSTRIKTAESTLPGPDPVTIPETQFNFTPTEKKLDSYKQNKMNSFLSPSTLQEEILDNSLVPDTPENLKSEQQQPKKKFSARSYLLSSSEFGSNPIQLAKENREAKLTHKRKQVSAARKSLVSVSVNFNDNKSHGTDIHDQGSKLGETAVNQADVTPTKVSGNGFSLKRMAKSGVSPDPKRNSGSDNVDTGGLTLVNDGESKDYTIMKNLNFDEESLKYMEDIADEINDNELRVKEIRDNKIRETEIAEMNKKAALANERLAQKRKEKLEKLECEKQEKLQKQKQIAKEQQKKNTIKQINYQLHGQTGMPKKEEKSVKDDDLLDNILDELNCSKTRHKAVTKVTKQSIKLEKDAMKGADNKKDMKQPLKNRYSLDNVLKFGQDSPKDQTIKKTCQVSSRNKASELFEKLSSEWTEEDEALMMELDMKPEIKKIHHKGISDTHINTCDAKNSDKMNSLSSKDKLIHIKSISKTVSNVNKCDTMEKNVINSHEDMIVDSTPAVKHELRPDANDHEDIDEFMTQLDSEFICDKIEQFTPFKDKRPREEEPTWLNKAPCVEFGRHIISQVERIRDQIVLEVLSQPGELNRKCYLHGNWQDAHVVVGDTVHILGEFKDAECHITDQCGFIIVNPDLLLSGTTVVGSVFCMRRSILKEKFKGCEKGNIQMLYGNILHSVFQEVLRKGLTGDKIFEEASKIVKQTENLLMIYSNDATEEKVMEEVKNYLPQIKSWTKKYTNIGKTGTHRPTDVEVLVTKVNDIEENIWSPRLGIKGKIDLTVDVLQKGENRTRTLPLELKTGRTSYSVEHKGQVTLYSMMSSDRRQDPGRGLLLYLKEPSMKVIPADQHSKAGLVQLRNEMAYYITRQVVKTTNESEATYTLGTLPDPISNIRACEKCPQLVNCAIYQRDVEGRSVRDDSKGRLIQETLNHLSLTHIDYYTHWCLMLDLETQADRAKKTLSDIWCLSSNDREKRGACFSGMVIQTSNLSEGNCHVSFARHQNNNRAKPLSSVGPVVTDSVVIGCESLSWIAICTGFIKQVSATELQVYMDREGVERLSNFKEETFRIDLCDSFSTAGIFYTNVSRLMINEHRFEVLRSLIIEKMKPEFLNTLSKTHIEKVKGIFKSLNKPQKTAILKVLMSKHYVLIRGYPGTGKTSTIVAIVKVLNILGLSVLLTSYTHSAVDNILLKLKKDNLKFLRLGRISKVHPEIRERCSDVLTKKIKSVQELQTFFNSQTIVATSCLGTNHPLFSQRTFDVCIVDEASQVLQPACLGPLFASKRFVLVGDAKQLPPVVQSKEASFDYAQQVFYPNYAQQVGPLYFKTPRKCQCFGVCSESSGSQIFYLVDEAHYVGKGANSVASMLHHHFQHQGYGEKKAHLHMDNCSGQNKNNAVIGYGMWRTMLGLHKEIEFNCMEAGHTKFNPDWHFGLWKVRWRHSTVETPEDIARTVTESSRNGHNIPQLVDDPNKPVIFFDWVSFLKKLFRPIPSLKKYHHFRDLGMAESLLDRLEGLGATFDLNLQYRMNSEIMSISNSLIYNNCLKCGTDTIANRTLGFADQEIVQEIVVSNPWMKSVFDSELDKSVVFLNTEHIPAPELREKGGIVKNEMEAKIVKEIVMALLKANVDSTDIGIIAPYRSQVFLIRNLFHEGQGHLSHVEVNTVDQYQGRDKTVIIISFVRSSSDVDTKRMGELLNDVRRLNVAVTRSKCKLVMVGNISVLQHYKPVKEIIDMSRNKQQIYLKEQ